jgi:membrane protein implicated in regulation of membrane protease activity
VPWSGCSIWLSAWLPKSMNVRTYTALAVVSGILEQAVLVAVVLGLLPRLGIYIPLWALVFMMIALGAYGYMAFRYGRKALQKRPMMSSEAMVGRKCTVVTALAPKGYVKVGSELWQASSPGLVIHKGQQVVIVGIEEMTLLVAPVDSYDGQEKAKHA